MARICAVNCVALTKVVVRGLPFHRTVAPLTKFRPLTVSVKPAPPAVADEGLRLVIAGVGLLIVKVKPFDVPPPGEGLVTVTVTRSPDAMSLAGIATVNCVALTKVVVRALPFHCTVEPLMKFVPLTVSVKPVPPAVTAFGLKPVIVGMGFCAWPILKLTALDVPPPGAGLLTVTLDVPVVAMSVAGICAVSCVALTNAVVRALPFHCTVEPATKPLPFTVKVNAAPPAVAPVGFKLLIVGEGLLIVKVAAGDDPPPGAGFITTTVAVPAVARSLAGIAAVN